MKKINKLSIIGFILGIVSFFIVPFVIPVIQVLTITFSGLGLYYIKKNKEGGKIFALIGLILGIITILTWYLLLMG